jgi:ATP-dependent Clp protease ATP-binding subunit ClpA
MSDFSAPDSAARLVGPLPGAGSGEPPQLVDAIRRKPDSVIVFDEVEKAHPKVIEILYQLCDTGCITDGQGRRADASRAVVVMTSNVGSGSGPQPGEFDAGATVPLNRGAQRKARVRKLFGADFLVRIDEIITLRHLDEADVRRLTRPLLARLVARVRKTHGVFLRLGPEAESFVIRSGFDEDRGARELKTVIERLVERPLSSLALSGKLSKHPAWKAVYEKGRLHFLPE